MANGGRYSALLTVFVGLLVFGAVYAMGTLISAVVRKPLAASEGSDAFLVKNAQAIRPPRAAYEAFAKADAAWRAANAPPLRWETLSGGDFEWHPSARQLATDSAYMLGNAGHTDAAIDVLTRYVAQHPSDVDVLVDLARLENTRNRTDAAVAHYNQALAQKPLAGARAELATLLLDAKRYDAAEREYRRLLALDTNSVAYHEGLAHAYAWSDRPRAAEPELRWLVQHVPNDTTDLALLRSVRASWDPSPSEAARWLAEDSGYTPYRLAYARALAASKLYARAAAQYDTVLAREAGGGRREAYLSTLRDAAYAHNQAGDTLTATRLIGQAVALAPQDDSLRLEYAQMLAATGDRTGAISQYARLIDKHPSAGLLLARGQLYVWSGDYAHGTPDLLASAQQQPSYDAYATLGDVYRWTGRYGDARTMYQRALALRPQDPRVLLAMADIANAERLYGAAAGAGDAGWTVASDYAEDNAGFLYNSLGVTRGFQVGRHTILSVGADQRRIAQRYYDKPEQYAYGWEANVGATHQLAHGLALQATAGVARHANVGSMALGSLGATWTHNQVSTSLEIARGPVYQSLMSMPTIEPAARTGFLVDPTKALVGRTLTASASVPVSRVNVTVSAERLALSDGNSRTTLGVAARLPITNNVAAVYQGGTLGYAQASNVYWDPSRYTSHMVGVEVAVHPARNLSLTARALPGIASTVETAALPESTNTRFTLPRRQAMQFATGGDLAWRARSNVQVDASLGYGRGREGSYQSMSGTFRVRLGF